MGCSSDHFLDTLRLGLTTGFLLGILLFAGLWVAEGVRRVHQSAWFQHVLNRDYR